MTKSRGIAGPRRRWLDWEVQLLREHYADSFTVAIATVLDRPVNHVTAKAHALGLHKNRDLIVEEARARMTADHPARKCGFRPGHVPANKGLRQPGWSAGRMAQTQFQKGQKSRNWKPLGSFRVNSDGCLDIKVADTGYPPRDWMAYHRHLWTQANGPIPAGHVLRFKEGRRTTDAALITLDALELITLRENLARNSLHNLPPELVQVIQLRGILNRKINRESKTDEQI